MRAVSDDTHYGFAIGRVRAREAALLDDARWDRLIRSRDEAEFRAMLTDTAYGQFLREGYQDGQGKPGTRADLESKAVMGKPGTRSDLESKAGIGKPGTRADLEDKSVMSPLSVAGALARAAEENFAFFAGYCRDRPVLDAFRIQADIHNLKLAAKAAWSGRAVDPEYRLGYGRWSEEEREERVEPGTAPCRTRSSQGAQGSRGPGSGKAGFGERWREAVGEFLSSKAGTRSDLKDESAISQVSEPEPARLDAMLDRAAHAEAAELVRGNRFLAGLFLLRADTANLIALVRVRLLGEERGELAAAILPGGSIKPTRLMELFNDDWDALVAKMRPTRYGRMVEDGVAQVQAERSTLRLERLGRELELGLLRRARLIPFGFEPLVGYYLFREQEIGNLRRLAAAKRAGLDEAVCAEVVARG